MDRLRRLKIVAEYLTSQNRYYEAYIIYDEIYRQMWYVISSIQNILRISFINLISIINKSKVVEQEKKIDSIFEHICLKRYNIHSNEFLNDFIKILYERLRCICFSNELRKEVLIETVLNEFLMLYVLVMQPINQKRVSSLLRYSTSVIDANNLVNKVKANYSKTKIESMLLENIEKYRNEEAKIINNLLLQYLKNVYNTYNTFYNRVKALIDQGSCNSYFQNHSSKQNESFSYESYERYERYERFRYDSNYSNNFNQDSLMTEEEKKVYYGKLIGLQGKVTKSQIRAKYLELISQYHPDKVQHLGPELRKLAETKTKELNEAYEWFKSKYHL